MRTQHQPNAAMKIAIAAFAVLLTASPGHSQATGNCFTVSSYENQELGSPVIIPVYSCKENCLRQSCILIRQSGERFKQMTSVSSCTKDDLFDDSMLCDDERASK